MATDKTPGQLLFEENLRLQAISDFEFEKGFPESAKPPDYSFLHNAQPVRSVNLLEEADMWVFIRAVTYATLFIGFVLVVLPARVLSWSGITAIPVIGVWQVLGMILAGLGGAIALSCILTFIFIGKGTPAPFDPPRRLVVGGPYRIIRNPMYAGAGLTLAGAALFYESGALTAYACAFGVVTHVFVVFYEEPALRQAFGSEYEVYCAHVGRWRPFTKAAVPPSRRMFL